MRRRGRATAGRSAGRKKKNHRIRKKVLTNARFFAKISLAGADRAPRIYAGVAQSVEQLICNQQVGGSSPSTSSTSSYGGVPEWPKGTDCKSAGDAYGGSNPPAPTIKETSFVYQGKRRFLMLFGRKQGKYRQKRAPERLHGCFGARFLLSRAEPGLKFWRTFRCSMHPHRTAKNVE